MKKQLKIINIPIEIYHQISIILMIRQAVE